MIIARLVSAVLAGTIAILDFKIKKKKLFPADGTFSNLTENDYWNVVLFL